MGTLVLIFLFSCPAFALCYCHVKAKMKTTNQSREPSLIHLSILQDDCHDLRVQEPEYEEIQVTRNPNFSGSSTFSAPGLIVDYSLTLCPAYGQVSQESRAGTVVDFPSFPPHTSSRPQAPEYEDIHELQVARNATISPSGVPDLAAAYTFTRCPAYEQVPQDSGVEFETVAEISSLPPCAPFQQRVPEYDELRATKNAAFHTLGH